METPGQWFRIEPETHLMAFVAEEARLENKVVDMQEFKQRAGV